MSGLLVDVACGVWIEVELVSQNRCSHTKTMCLARNAAATCRRCELLFPGLCR